MPPAIASTPDSSSSALRRLKIFALILVVSNLLLGCFSAYLLRSIDRNYSDLIDRNFPLMDGLRLLTKETGAMQRHVLGVIANHDPARRAESLGKLETATAKQRQLLADALRADRVAALAEIRPALAKAAADYEKGLASFRELVAAGKIDDANALRYDVLRPALNHYLDTIDQAAFALEDRSQRINDTYSGRVRTHSTILLGLASWPLMVGLVVVVVVALIIGVLVLVYRQIGTEQY
ncbi:MAG: MCP four helix bundle domain-containing protein [Opitutae bacterium]|nr:MCP four helix bundle domain-containing protein [Opitutae bacterium]